MSCYGSWASEAKLVSKIYFFPSLLNWEAEILAASEWQAVWGYGKSKAHSMLCPTAAPIAYFKILKETWYLHYNSFIIYSRKHPLKTMGLSYRRDIFGRVWKKQGLWSEHSRILALLLQESSDIVWYTDPT